MKCPFCGHENTRVIDSRPAEDNNTIRRRRVCDECDKKHYIYGESHIDEIAEKYGIKNIAKLPIDPEFAKAADKGEIESCADMLSEFADKILG